MMFDCAKRCTSFRHSIWKYLATLCFVVLFAGTTLAQSVPASIAAKVELLSRLPSLRAAEIDSMLSQLGFAPNMSHTDWSGLSSREQIEIAYRSADAAGGENGERFVHGLARQIETKYESIAFDPLFQSLFLAEAPPTGTIRYVVPTQVQSEAALPKNISAALDALSVYVEGTGPLGRVNVLRSHFNLRSPDLERALARRDSKAMLMFAAANAVPPPTVEVRVNQLARDAYSHFDSPGADQSLQDALKKMNAESGEPPAMNRGQALAVADDGAVVPAAPSGGGGGGSPERVARAAKAHSSLDRAHYPTAESRRFTNVRMRAGGRGGVIAGSTVTAPAGIGTPSKIWINVPNNNCAMGQGMETLGNVVLDFVDGKRLQLIGVACDAMIASKRLVYDSIGGVGPWQPGDAIGLASIAIDRDQGAFPFFIPKDLDTARIGSRKRMILHPGLIDLDVGRSVALLDLWPSAGRALIEASANSPHVITWLKDLQVSEAMTWKWSDANMLITVHGSQLKVSGGPLAFRVFDMQDIALESMRESLREASKDELTQLAAECREPDSEEGKLLCSQLAAASRHATSGRDLRSFLLAAQDMMSRVYDVQRASQLMQVLAVFRWARENGAQFAGVEPRLPEIRSKTPDSILIGFDGSWIATDTNISYYYDDCLEFFDRFGKLKQMEAKESDVGSDGLRRLLLVEILNKNSAGLESCKLP